MASIGVLIALSVCFSLVSVVAGLPLAWTALKVGRWVVLLGSFVVPFAFGWVASAICRGRVARLPLLVFLAPAVSYSATLLVWDLLGLPRDAIGPAGHLLVVGPHMLFAGAGALAWSWRQSLAL